MEELFHYTRSGGVKKKTIMEENKTCFFFLDEKII